MPIIKAEKIPKFEDGYYLPPGIHVCGLGSFKARFADHTKRRRIIWIAFVKFLEELQKHDLEPYSIILNGSYVTGRSNPRDLDCIFIIEPDKVKMALKERKQGGYKLLEMMTKPGKRLYCEAKFGIQPFLALNAQACSGLTNLFRFGKRGTGLRDPDPKKDPEWVTKPYQKGIIKIIISGDKEGE